MGMLLDGQWLLHGPWRTNRNHTIRNGNFVRAKSSHWQNLPARVINEISQQPGRYVLVVSRSCPWSHRVLLVRAIKGLNDKLPLLIAGGPRVQGYALNRDDAKLLLDLEGLDHLHQIYTIDTPDYTGRATVPVLWDRQDGCIISNESARIMRGLNLVKSGARPSLAPAHLVDEIDALNQWIYEKLANAVYRAGLSETQSAHDTAVEDVFSTLDTLEDRLRNNRYLFGKHVMETDLILFATLVRFDTVYATHFRCTRHRLTDYSGLWAYSRDLYSSFDFSSTVDFDEIQSGYYLNDGDNNPHGIIPELPVVDWNERHDRAGLGNAGN